MFDNNVYSIPIDVQAHGRFYLLAALFICWWLVSAYGKTVAAMSVAAFQKLKSGERFRQMGKNSGWIAAIAVIVLLWPDNRTPFNPSPGPQPDVVNPDPARKLDGLDRAFETYRTLLAELITEFSTQDFAGDDKAIEFLETRLNAAQEGAFGPFSDRLATDAKRGPEVVSKLADEIKRREVK